MQVKQSSKSSAVKIDHRFLLDCASNKNLTKKSYRVLLYLLTLGNSKDFSQVTQKEIAEDLEMDKSSVSLALKNLVEEDIIINFPYGQYFRFVEIIDFFDENDF